MIFDSITRLQQYLPTEVWSVLQPLVHRFNADEPDGEYPVWNREVFAGVSSYKTKPANEGRFESHRDYIDIQIVLDGSEQIDVCPVELLIPETDYDDQNDIRFYELMELPPVRLTMKPGSFALFFPQDAHCPQLSPNGESQNVRKMVVKIKKTIYFV